MLRAVVFDFDGVLADSEPLHFRAYRDVLGEEGITLAEADYYAKYLGYDDVGAFAAMAADRGLDWSAERIDELVERKARGMEALAHDDSVLFPGAADAVRRLAARCPIAIVSGALRREIERILDHADLTRYFAVIVSAEDAPASKPAPDPYLRAIQLLSAGFAVSPAECVAIEDSRWGLESAVAAGFRTVAVTHTYPAPDLAVADAIVPRLDCLTWEFLSNVRSRR